MNSKSCAPVTIDADPSDRSCPLLLTDKTIVITGAGQGLGAALAEGLARSGGRVIMLDIAGPSVEKKAEDLRATGLQASAYVLDVRDAQACRDLANKLAQEIGPIHALVNNAGINSKVHFTEPDALETWDRVMNVNVNGCVNAAHAFVQQLQITRGAIVNMASIASFTAGTSSFAYVVSKGAIRSLTQVLARDLAPMGIRVNAIAPSMIATEMNIEKRKNLPLMQAYLKRVLLNRIGTPDDVIGPVAFLCSDLASYITGTVLPVDGGYLAA